MVLEEHVGLLNNTQKDYLRIVVENSSRIVRALNELAQVAALEPLSFELLDAGELIQELLLLWRPRVLSRSVQLREVLPAECCFLWGDRQRLAEAIEEIFSGIAESTERGSEIVVEMSRSGEKVRVGISRTVDGAGLKATRDAFVPGGASSAPQAPSDHSGSFSLAESVIRLHGGRLEASGDPSSPVGLTIVLPACSGAESRERESRQ
jgi:signal transduction histidine kinase